MSPVFQQSSLNYSTQQKENAKSIIGYFPGGSDIETLIKLEHSMSQ